MGEGGEEAGVVAFADYNDGDFGGLLFSVGVGAGFFHGG